MTVWERIAGPQGRAALVLIAVFLAGGGSGYFLGRWEAARFAPWEGRRAPFARRVRGADRGRFLMERLNRDLSLRPEQSEHIGAALRRHHERLMTLRQEMGPRVDDILQQARGEMRGYLDPGQREAFDRLVAEFDERRRRWRERRMRRHMERMRGPGMMGPPGGR